MSHQLGQRAGYEALEHGRPLLPLLNAALATRTTAPGSALLGGLLEVVCSVLDACQRQGIAFAMTDAAKQIASALPQARRLLITALCQHVDQSAADVLSELARAILCIKDSVSVSAPAALDRPEPLLMRMEIVAMPDRKIEQTITRRENGDLVGASSIEQDA